MDGKIPTGPQLAAADIAHACCSRDKSNGPLYLAYGCTSFRGASNLGLVKRACGMRDGWVEWLVHAPSMDPDTRPGSGHQASGLEPQVPLKRPGTGLDHQEEDAVLWKPEAGCPYPHYPHTWGTSWEVAGAVCSTASLRRTREKQAQSPHVVSGRAISFLCIANYSIHPLGSEGWAEAPMQRQVSAKQKSLELLVKRHRLPPCSITSTRKNQETDKFYARLPQMPDAGRCQPQQSVEMQLLVQELS
ncbi:hypothetical protein CI102_11361 [Trichoderma harzianum]|nr:hypothetical protein CI102_11361 [Trichoderma harzianum]